MHQRTKVGAGFLLGAVVAITSALAAGQLASAHDEPVTGNRSAEAIEVDGVPALLDPDDAPQLLSSTQGGPVIDGSGRVALLYPEKADEVLAPLLRRRAAAGELAPNDMVRYVDYLDVLVERGAVEFHDADEVQLDRYCTPASVKAEKCKLPKKR